MNELPTNQPPPPTTPPLSVPAGGPPYGEPAGDQNRLPAGNWGPGRAFAGLAFVFAASVVLGAIVIGFDSELESLAAQAAIQGLLAGAMVLGAFLFARPALKGLAAAQALGLRRPVRKAIWLTIVTYFGYVACALVVALLLSPEQEDIARELGGDSGVIGAVIAGFLVIVVAPVSEEIFFRGFFFAGLRRGMHVAIAALISSAVWGLLHYTGAGTWGVVVQITVFGLWLSWLYERTGSIYPTIAVHMVNNAIAFTILLSS
jgi:membrane protease YdiL (CAAX protease family)